MNQKEKDELRDGLKFMINRIDDGVNILSKSQLEYLLKAIEAFEHPQPLDAGEKAKKCYNCKHGGKQFKIVGKTHLHCEHPKYTEEDFMSGKISPWDTLMEFWQTCEDYEPKN